MFFLHFLVLFFLFSFEVNAKTFEQRLLAYLQVLQKENSNANFFKLLKEFTNFVEKYKEANTLHNFIIAAKYYETFYKNFMLKSFIIENSLKEPQSESFYNSVASIILFMEKNKNCLSEEHIACIDKSINIEKLALTNPRFFTTKKLLVLAYNTAKKNTKLLEDYSLFLETIEKDPEQCVKLRKFLKRFNFFGNFRKIEKIEKEKSFLGDFTASALFRTSPTVRAPLLKTKVPLLDSSSPIICSSSFSVASTLITLKKEEIVEKFGKKLKGRKKIKKKFPLSCRIATPGFDKKNDSIQYMKAFVDDLYNFIFKKKSLSMKELKNMQLDDLFIILNHSHISCSGETKRKSMKVIEMIENKLVKLKSEMNINTQNKLFLFKDICEQLTF